MGVDSTSLPPPPPPLCIGRVKATVSNRVKPDYHFIRIVFCSFMFLSCFFQPDSCVSWQAMLKTCQHILDIVGLS